VSRSEPSSATSPTSARCCFPGRRSSRRASSTASKARLQDRRDLEFVRARYALVTKHAEIQERELIKLATLAMAVAKALHARGISEPAASLAAEAGIAVFKVGFERWVSERKPRDLATHIRAAMGVLRAVAAEGKGTAPRAKRKPTRRAWRV
jgi:hypothetical protein